MKKIIVISILLLSVSFTRGQVFIGTKPTENSALLEVESNNRGILIPRINIPNTSDAFPAENPKTGLLVMNIHPGNEGLFFWNGQEWEKLKTVESAVADLRQTGNRNVFIGMTEIAKGQEPKFIKNNGFEVSLEAFLGAVTDNGKSYTIQEDGVYEISTGFTAEASKIDAIVAAYIWKNEKDKYIAYTTTSQSSYYSEVAAKAVYCGPLEKDDKIGLVLVYITADSSNKVPKLKTANLSVKKINVN